MKVGFLGPVGTNSEFALDGYKLAHQKASRQKTTRTEPSRDSSKSFLKVQFPSIREVFKAVTAGEIDLGFVPIENLIQGHVSETLDCLHSFKKKVYISDVYIYEVKHAVGFYPNLSTQKSSQKETLPLKKTNNSKVNNSSAKNTTKLTETFTAKITAKITEKNLGKNLEKTTDKVFKNSIKYVYSHPQALGQCLKYLQTNYPNAELIPVSSTATAAQELSKLKSSNALAIAPEQTLEANKLTVIDTNVSDIKGKNFTKFITIQRGDLEQEYFAKNLGKNTVGNSNIGNSNVGNSTDKKGTLKKSTTLQKSALVKSALQKSTLPYSTVPYSTVLIVNPRKDRKCLLLDLLKIISEESNLNLYSLHSRPDTRNGLIFYMEIEGHFLEERFRELFQKLQDYAQKETLNTIEFDICGSYPRRTLSKNAIRKVGIVGGEGKMGQWFSKFLQNEGIAISIFDKGSKQKFQDFVKGLDVCILSLPMSVSEQTLSSYVKALEPGQLVVENCSIKQAFLPRLSKLTKKGVEVLGIHTMFGPDVSKLSGQNIIITKTDSSASMTELFEELFYKNGARLHYVDIQEHDSNVAFVQSLVHLVALALGEVMTETFSQESNLEAFNTPNSKAILGVVRKVLNQTSELTFDLQTLNPNFGKFIKLFKKSLNGIIAEVDAKDKRGFEKKVTKIRELSAKINYLN